MDIRDIRLVPYYFKRDYYSKFTIEEIRDMINDQIPYYKSLSKLTDLHNVVKFSLMYLFDKKYPSRHINENEWIVNKTSQISVTKEEDDDNITFTLNNKRTGKFDSVFNIIMVYIKQGKYIIPFSSVVLEEDFVFNKDINNTFIMKLKKE